jgi:superfamily II DNA or RNA helicase
MKEADLKISEGKKVVVATYAMAEEGLDIKTLTTLIMATPKTDVTQAVGRILRKKEKKKLVVDIVDSHGMFQRQYIKRRRFYNKQNFKIMETDVVGFKKNDWTTYSSKRKSKKGGSLNQPLLQGKLLFDMTDD